MTIKIYVNKMFKPAQTADGGGHGVNRKNTATAAKSDGQDRRASPPDRATAARSKRIPPGMADAQRAAIGTPDAVVSWNLKRRHLSVSQKSTLAIRLKPMFETKAKERQEAAGGDHGNQHTGGKMAVRANLPEAAKGKSTDQAAAAGVSGRTVQDAVKLRRWKWTQESPAPGPPAGQPRNHGQTATGMQGDPTPAPGHATQAEPAVDCASSPVDGVPRQRALAYYPRGAPVCAIHVLDSARYDCDYSCFPPYEFPMTTCLYADCYTIIWKFAGIVGIVGEKVRADFRRGRQRGMIDNWRLSTLKCGT